MRLVSGDGGGGDVDAAWAYVLVAVVVIVSLSDFSRRLKCSSISFECVACCVMKYRTSLTFPPISSKTLKGVSTIAVVLSSSWLILLRAA